MRYLPVDASNNYLGTFPYFSTTANSNYPENLSSPVNQDLSTSYAMMGSPDPKTYDLEYDDVKNLYANSVYPFYGFN